MANLQSLRQIPRISRGIFLTLLLLAVTGVRAEPADASPLFLADELLQTLIPQESSLSWEELERFYAENGCRPVWMDALGPNWRAGLLRQRLHMARDEGLTPRHYQIERIDSLWSSRERKDRLLLELMLSSVFFDYAQDARNGRLPPQHVAPLWEIDPTPVDPVALLRAALSAEDFSSALDALPPEHPAYRRLRTALADYRLIEAQGGWGDIPQGPSLRRGMRGPRVEALRRRLEAEGEIGFSPSFDAALFDETLDFAVRRFQVRHGLQVDGVVGKRTLAALNVTVARRIEQIVLTMERWRWLPQDLGRRHLIVNIPSYELIAYEDGEAGLSMPVIIGALERPTPAISGMLHTIVFNPYWTVPRSIALRDLVPRQRSNPNYMLSQGIRVFAGGTGGVELDPQEVDWSAVNVNFFPYTLRQDPGPKNALGKLKFLFNNRHAIYLHDTPHTGLFATSERAYSSGCIRLEEPLRLASFVLAEEPVQWSEQGIRRQLESDRNYGVRLTRPLPVYLLYLTAWVGEDGAVHFHNDIYGEDELVRVCMPFEEQSL
ncbi:MAG: L,D-transpeptidase family protein [Pseudomonadota bacterium]